jgi:energy-coupling factor transporter ATP-binding protein EcfA2
MQESCVRNTTALRGDESRVAFVGDPGAGRTTLAALFAGRLTERGDARVRVTGEATELVDGGATAGTGPVSTWTVRDAEAGPGALADLADQVETVFLVVTPDGLGGIEAYERAAERAGVDLAIVGNRFSREDIDPLREHEGAPVSEYVPPEPEIAAAMARGEGPRLADRTIERLAVDALAEATSDRSAALAALDAGTDRTLDVEVETDDEGRRLVTTIRERGHRASYYRCNCRCHAGHLLARSGRSL